MSRLPTFLIIGAAKAGTTSLHHYVGSHPDVFTAAKKELNFFVAEHNWDRGRDWYAAQFDGAGQAIAVGEASPQYAHHPIFDGVPERIAQTIPDVRLVYVVRHPIERIRSHWTDRVIHSRETRPLADALNDPVYTSASSYALQLERYLKHFERDQILVLTSDELRRRRVETVKRVHRFIGVDDSWIAPDIDQELYRTEERLIRRRPLWRVGTNRAWELVARSVPGFARDAVRPVLKRRVSPRDSRISERLTSSLADELRADVARLRTYLGSDFDGWDLL